MIVLYVYGHVVELSSFHGSLMATVSATTHVPSLLLRFGLLPQFLEFVLVEHELVNLDV